VGPDSRKWKNRASPDNDDLKVIDYDAKDASTSSLRRTKVLTIHKPEGIEGRIVR
jgi:hypothetical protein